MPDESDASGAFVGVDWGTSNARFMLLDASGKVLDETIAPGVARLAGPGAIEQVCLQAIDSWRVARPDLSIIMAGMVGSNIGWRLVPYIPTPASAQTLSSGAARFSLGQTQVVILPGVQTVRADGLPDVMRGEETQIFGAITGADEWVCLPGTHTKWARVMGGVITRFHTAMTGELIETLGLHSILLNPRRAPRAELGEAFHSGVATARDNPAGLEVLLFGVRSRQITGELSTAQAESYLAGLIIGADIRSAVTGGFKAVTVVGSPALTALYVAALTAFGVQSREEDGRTAVVRGLVKAREGLKV